MVDYYPISILFDINVIFALISNGDIPITKPYQTAIGLLMPLGPTSYI